MYATLRFRPQHVKMRFTTHTSSSLETVRVSSQQMRTCPPRVARRMNSEHTPICSDMRRALSQLVSWASLAS